MKSLIKILFAAIVLITANAFAKAEVDGANKKAAANTLHQYIATTTQGKVENIDELFSNQFRHNINGDGKVFTHTKEQVVEFLKGRKNVQEDCVASYRIIEQNETCAIARVEMKYLKFTRINYVTLSREGSEWKISQVTTTFRP
jgi:hypothetical protein